MQPKAVSPSLIITNTPLPVRRKEMRGWVPAGTKPEGRRCEAGGAPARRGGGGSQVSPGSWALMKAATALMFSHGDPEKGPGEVDDRVRDEATVEGLKHGDLLSCRAIEVPGAPDEEAARIFFEYARPAEAALAKKALDGQVFAGRELRCCFFSEFRT